jgi:hypothetical protein
VLNVLCNYVLIGFALLFDVVGFGFGVVVSTMAFIIRNFTSAMLWKSNAIRNWGVLPLPNSMRASLGGPIFRAPLPLFVCHFNRSFRDFQTVCPSSPDRALSLWQLISPTARLVSRSEAMEGPLETTWRHARR